MKNVLLKLKKLQFTEQAGQEFCNDKKLLKEIELFRITLEKPLRQYSKKIGTFDAVKYAEMILANMPDNPAYYDVDMLQKLLNINEIYISQNLDGQSQHDITELFHAISTKIFTIREQAVKQLTQECNKCLSQLQKDTDAYREVSGLHSTLQTNGTDNLVKLQNFNAHLKRKETQQILSKYPDSAVKRFLNAVGYIMLGLATMGCSFACMKANFFKSPQQRFLKKANKEMENAIYLSSPQ